MALPNPPTTPDSSKLHYLLSQADSARVWVAVEVGPTAGANTIGWAGVATHKEDDQPTTPGGITTTKAPVVLVAGDDGGAPAKVIPLQVNATGILKVQNEANAAAVIGTVNVNSGQSIAITGTVPVSAVSLPLPTGASTETTLASRLAEATFTTRIPVNGQAAMAASIPVVLASNQTTVAVSLASLPALAAGAATIGAVNLAQYTPIDVDSGAGVLNAIPITWRRSSSGGAEFGTSTDPLRIDPTGTTTQPVSVASLPLPSGAATEATLARINTQGQKGMSASTPVVLASDQTSIPVSSTVIAVTPGVTAAALGKAEDAPHTSGDTGVFVLAVRNDAGGAMVSLTGDYAPLQVNSAGALVVTGSVAGTQFNEDNPHTTGDLGTMTLAVRRDVLSSLVNLDGDYAPLQVDSSGSLRVTGGGGGQEYNEADAATGINKGGTMMAERQDTLGTLAEANATFANVRVNNRGALWVNIDQTVAVSVASLPLPTGAATEATLAARLADATFTARIPVLGQALMASSIPVVIASNQTVAVSAASLPLPSGAATETSLASRLAEATFTTRIPVNGQAAMAASVPVVIASNQSAVPVVGSVAHDGATPGNPVVIGGVASADEPAEVNADLDVVRLWADRKGRLIVRSGHPRPEIPAQANLTLTTDATIIAAPAAGQAIHVTHLVVTNMGATLLRAILKEGAAGPEAFHQGAAANGGGVGMSYDWVLPNATALVGALSAVGDVRVTICYYIAPR